MATLQWSKDKVRSAACEDVTLLSQDLKHPLTDTLLGQDADGELIKMPDMLVRLYDLPPLAPALEQQLSQGITIRRVIPPEKHVVVGFVRHAFSEFWVTEVEVAFAHQPPTCFVAIEAKRVIGFAVYDTTAKGFFSSDWR